MVIPDGGQVDVPAIVPDTRFKSRMVDVTPPFVPAYGPMDLTFTLDLDE